MSFKIYDPVQVLLMDIFFPEPDKPPFDPDALEVPEQTIGVPIGVLFGTRLIKKPHAVWHGDIKITQAPASEDDKKFTSGF